RARGNDGAVIRDIKAMGNLGALFSLAYDRGGKVVEMIHNRLGRERFFEFFHKVYEEYAWKTFHYADLRRELVEFDPSGGWDKFLDGWLVEHGETDWMVEQVQVGAQEVFPKERPVTIFLRQKGSMLEPTVVLCKTGGGEIRVPIWPERGNYEVPGAKVTHVDGEDRWVVTCTVPAEPTQVEVDPDHALLDAAPDNNRWKTGNAWRVRPMM